jgi:hypothetical protein
MRVDIRVFYKTFLEDVLQFTLMIEENSTKDILKYQQLLDLQSNLLLKTPKPDPIKIKKLNTFKRFMFNFGIPKSTRSLFNAHGRQSRK